MAYFIVKSLHLLFVVAWLAAVFYLPRILVNIAEDGAAGPVRERLVLMGRRLYTFGHNMFGIAVVLGGVLWFYFKMSGPWLHAKLTLVAVLLAFYIVTGRMLKRVAAGGTLPSSKALRWFNELPILVALGIIYLVIAKPF